jgi:hypothetical protein
MQQNDADKHHAAADGSILLQQILAGQTEIHGWKMTDIRTVPGWEVETFWARGTPPNRFVLRIDGFARATKIEAKGILDGLLGRFELPGMRLRPDAGFGDEVYALDTGYVILFSVNSIVFLLRNVGLKPVEVWDVARFIDSLFRHISQ